MAASSLTERISASFAAWEFRGRGWQVTDYPVSLEPPYRPFFLLPETSSTAISTDDGRRPTFLSSLYERFTETPKRLESEHSFEEMAPFPAADSENFVIFRLHVPSETDIPRGNTTHLLASLLSAIRPVSFEIVGSAGKTLIQITAAASDAPHVADMLAVCAPAVVAIEEDDALARIWDIERPSLVVDFGYAEEFFLPLPSFKYFAVDPYAAFVAACARTGVDEVLSFQVLFEKAKNPWGKAILHAVAPAGSPLFVDAPEFVPGAREKTASPLSACIVRVGVQARTEERTLDLARSALPFVNQFSRPGGNSLIPLHNDEYPDNVHALAFLRRESFRTGMIISLEELSALVHIPDSSVQHESLLREDRRSKALPAIARGHTWTIGTNTHRGVCTPATLGTAERRAHTMIVGASGTGKSTLLVNMILQDVAAGDGIAVLDPHGDLIDDVLARIPDSRIDDVVVFDPSDGAWPVGINILGAESDLERTLLASDLTAVFQRLSTSWGDAMSTVLSNAVLAIGHHSDGGTLLTLRRFLVDERYRKEFLSQVTDSEVRFFWEKEWPLIGSRSIGPILTRLNTFLRPKVIRNVVGQRKPKLDFYSLMGKRRIFLAKLSQGLIGTENAYLLGSLLLSKLLQLSLSRQTVTKDERAPFWIYLDEAEHFVTPSVASLLTEARKYGVGLHLAFHMLSQLRSAPQVESAVLSNAHTRIVFRVGNDDARKLAEGFSYFEADDLAGLHRGEAIARVGETTNDFNLATAPLPMAAGAGSERVQTRSREQWAVARETIEAELRDVLGSVDAGAPEPAPLRSSARTSELEKGQVVAPPPPKRSRHEGTVSAEAAPLGRGGPEHKYLQHLIKRFADERGYRAIIEEPITGGQVDVALRRDNFSIACEISVTTDEQHDLANVRKCLDAGFGEVWAVFARPQMRDRFQRSLGDSSAKVRCLSAGDLVSAFETLPAAASMSEKIVGGYKVKARKRALSYEEVTARESALAEIVARSLAKQRKRD